jgi:hypothetical protein
MAPKQAMEKEPGVDVIANPSAFGATASPGMLVKRGRGHAKGSNNKPKPALPIPEGEGPEAWTRGQRDSVRENGPEGQEATPVGLSIGPPPPLEFSPAPGSVLRKAPSKGALYEFFVFVLEGSLEKLKLPDHFSEVFHMYDLGWFLIHEWSEGQETWKVETLHDGVGSVYLAGGWPEFARCYKLRQGSLLVFHHHEDTNKFLVMVFNNSQCHTVFHPAKA